MHEKATSIRPKASRKRNITVPNWAETKPSRDAMTEAQFNSVMKNGLDQAKANNSILADDAFDLLKSETDKAVS